LGELACVMKPVGCAAVVMGSAFFVVGLCKAPRGSGLCWKQFSIMGLELRSEPVYTSGGSVELAVSLKSSARSEVPPSPRAAYCAEKHMDFALPLLPSDPTCTWKTQGSLGRPRG